VTPERLGPAIAGARALGVRQLAVSIPHKEAVLAHVDELDTTARQIGAVNTVTLRGDRLVGSNTDWLGVARALERETNLAGRRAVVLGAGGTARAAVFALRKGGARVTVLNRTSERADHAGGLDALATLDFDVLVNTTSVGLRSDASPVPAAALRAGAVVLDAVYDPPETRLLRDARERGARPIGGKWMLVGQALEQIRLWSGKEAPVDVMADAFDRAS
jgi:shikimate dehydrogenase